MSKVACSEFKEFRLWRISFLLTIGTFVALRNINFLSSRDLYVQSSVSNFAMNSRGYDAASTEEYVMTHLTALDLDDEHKFSRGCSIFDSPLKQDLDIYLQKLLMYNQQMDEMPPIADLRNEIEEMGGEMCDHLKLGSSGLSGIFKDGHLSLTRAGLVEPLLPPLRHLSLCENRQYLMDLSFLIHDFEYMCRNQRRTSKNIFIDMGASLEFHGTGKQPAVHLIRLFEKFGFPFDHIYAFEVTQKTPVHVYELLPEDLIGSYHWINVGVSADANGKLNPLHSLLHKFSASDLVVVKLDIDTPEVERALVLQLLRDTSLHKIVDHFYFEHHVRLEELARYWGTAVNGSVSESLQIFQELRRKGIASHYWV